MSASSTTSTTDDNRSETEEFAGKGDGLLCRTPAILMPGSSSAYGISEFSTTGANHSHRGLGPMVSTSTISTLDRSAYQSLPLSGSRRITVQFGDMKIVVPWKDSATSTVGDLTEAALLRYKRACGNPNVKIVRLECASDGGILDPDDILEDVFDLAFDQILAIADEAGPQHHYAQPLPVNRATSKPVASAYGSISIQNPAPSSPSPSSTNSNNITPYNIGHKSRRDSIVEVKNLASAVSPGLRVHKTPTAVRIGGSVPNNENEPMLRSSLRSEKKQERQQARVTLSPEVEKKLAERERPHYEKNTSANRLLRSSDRKSRINDAFLDSRDRIVEKYEQMEISTQKPVKLGPVAEGPVPGSTVVTFLAPENVDFGNEEIIGMGVEVNAVYDDSVEAMPSTSNSKMTAVQIMRIDKNGRIGKDGRLKVGDNVIEIDGRPVYQMSILRARAYIADLAVSTKDASLTILRSIETFSDSDQIDQKPIFSALQAANTQYIGQTQVVELVKSSNGFGFTVTGRETAKGERLFYIGTVKPYGVALGHLKSGDRLLEINGESTGALTQLEIVDRLKEAMVGSKVRFLVSRVPAANEKENEPPTQSEPTTSPPKVVEPTITEEEDPTSTKNSRFDLVIPLNDSGSAGLGVSLKARVSVKSDASRHDCGIFIKNVMHGGAAFKDGRLKVNDRIVGIEDIELESLTNSAASDALTKKLKSIGPSSSHVKLSIIRESPSSSRKPGPISRDSSRITVDAASSSPTPSSSRITTPASFITSPHPTTTSDSHSRQTSSEMSAKEGEEEAMNETVLNGEVDPFDREAPGRKSLSEKRGIGAATGDPQHIKLFQEIKHQRQNSAPPASTSRSASEKRSKSQPRSMSQRNYYHRKQQQQMKNSETPEPPLASTLPREKPIDAGGIVNRRSLSMESINPKPGPLTAVQFSTPNGKEHPFPPGGSPSMRVKNEENRSRDKSRRKSVGNAMRSFFGFGSKSRDASPEKQQPVQLTSADKIRQPVFMDYGDAYHQQVSEVSSSTSTTSNAISPTVTLGNSRFYSSCRSPARLDTNLRPTRNSTADMRPIDIRHHHPMQKMHSIGEEAPVEWQIRQQRINKTRPISTMDYQHLIRTMQRQQYSPGAVVIQPPPYVAPTLNHPTNTINNNNTNNTTTITLTTSPINKSSSAAHLSHPLHHHHQREAFANPPTITTRSTRGSPTRAAEPLARNQCSATMVADLVSPMGQTRNRTDRQFASLPHRQFVTPPTRNNIQEQKVAKEPIVEEGGHEIMMRRKSMRMLEQLPNNHPILRMEAAVHRPASLYHDTVEVSPRLPRLQHQQHRHTTMEVQRRRQTSNFDVAAPDNNNIAPPPTHPNRHLIVFPSTRFPIASSSVRLKSTQQPPKLPASSIFYVPTTTTNSRLSMRSREILKSNENFQLLPPSTSTIMSTTNS